jgi:hypothetical protein
MIYFLNRIIVLEWSFTAGDSKGFTVLETLYIKHNYIRLFVTLYNNLSSSLSFNHSFLNAAVLKSLSF